MAKLIHIKFSDEEIGFVSLLHEFLNDNNEADMGECSNVSLEEMYILNTMEIGDTFYIPGNTGLYCDITRVPNHEFYY